MLAIANRYGEVQASIPGLARIAAVSVDDCEAAINKFLAPDKYSRTPDDEGRRIEKIDGGWVLLNHAKYREMASRDEAKMAAAERQRRFKDRRKRNRVTQGNALVTQGNDMVTDTLHIAEAEAEADTKKKNTCRISSDVEKLAKAIWKEYPSIGKPRSSQKKVIDAIKAIPALERPSIDVALAALAAWKKSEHWTRDGGQFVMGVHLWVKNLQWENIPEPAAVQIGRPLHEGYNGPRPLYD
jgi:hypothetical protein